MSKLKNLRKRLYEIDPLCPFCGVKMILPQDVPHQTYPDNLCTIEHIYSRFNPKRSKPNLNGERRRMICCRKCNMARGRKEELALGIEGLKEHAARKEKSKVTGSGIKPLFDESKSSVIVPIRSGSNAKKINFFAMLWSYIFPKCQTDSR